MAESTAPLHVGPPSSRSSATSSTPTTSAATPNPNPNPNPNPTTTSDARPLSLFRRELPIPPALASFASEEGQQLFASALQAGTMKCYFALAQQFRTQDEPAFCGISTLVMVLNALAVDPCRVWRAPWRWFHEDMLSCCTPLEQVRTSGISIPEWICLAECNGARVVKAVRGDPAEESLEDFRAQLIRSARTPSDRQALVLSYSRKQFAQTGDGHFSPFGGYCAERDAALILDVARFKLPAHWVKVEDLWRAMQHLDPATGRPRGYMVLEPSSLNGTLVFTFRTHLSDWRLFARFFRDVGQRLAGDRSSGKSKGSPGSKDTDSCVMGMSSAGCADCAGATEQGAVRCFFQCIPHEVARALTTYEADLSFASLPYRPQDHEQALAAIREEVQQLPVHALVRDALEALDEARPIRSAILATVLLLAFPRPTQLFAGTEQVFARLQDVSGCSQLLRDEIQTLHAQIEIMMSVAAGQHPGSDDACMDRCETDHQHQQQQVSPPASRSSAQGLAPTEDAFDGSSSPGRLELGVRYLNLSLCGTGSDFYTMSLPPNPCAGASSINNDTLMAVVRFTSEVAFFTFTTSEFAPQAGPRTKLLDFAIQPSPAAPAPLNMRVAIAKPALTSSGNLYDLVVDCVDLTTFTHLDPYYRPPTMPPEPPDLPVFRIGERFYQLRQGRGLNFWQARIAAANATFNGLVGRLATITSAEQNAALATHLYTHSPYIGAWVGGSNVQPEYEFDVEQPREGAQTFAHQWRWITEQPNRHFYLRAPELQGPVPGQFVNFRLPDSDPVSTFFMAITLAGDGKWDTRPCIEAFPYFVEFVNATEEAARTARIVARQSSLPVCDVCVCIPSTIPPFQPIIRCDTRDIHQLPPTGFPPNAQLLSLGFNPHLNFSSLLVADLPSSIERLDLSSAGLRAQDLRPLNASLPRLRRLFLPGNVISELTYDMLGELPNLRYISLAGNNLTRIAHDSLRGLPELRTLHLPSTLLTELPPGLLDSNIRLINIEISNTPLARLPDNLFSHTPDLTAVNLANNRISSLPTTLFNGHFPFLTLLYLTNNRITSLPVDVLANLTSLDLLDLENNLLGDSLAPRQFDGLRALFSLSLAGNGIRRVPSGFLEGSGLVGDDFRTYEPVGKLNMNGNPTDCGLSSIDSATSRRVFMRCTCAEGFISDETFSFCDYVTCAQQVDAVDFARSNCTGERRFEGDNCTVSCLDGHLGGEATYYCNADGQWQGSLVCGPRLVAVSRLEATLGGNLSAALVTSVTGFPPFTYALDDSGEDILADLGLQLRSTDGQLAGQPRQAGAFPLALRVQDSRGLRSATQSLLLVVHPALQMNVTFPTTATQGWPVTSPPVARSGGTGTLTLDVLGLPSGLAMATDGSVSGTPQVHGTFAVTFHGFDEGGGQVSITKSLFIAPRLVIGQTEMQMTSQARFEGIVPTVSGGFGELEFFTDQRLPAGVTLDRKRGQLVGTPTEPGAFEDLSVFVRDDNAAVALVNRLAIVVAPALKAAWPADIDRSSRLELERGQAVAAGVRPVVVGGRSPIRFFATGSNLPPGTQIGTDGALEGRPVVSGTFLLSLVVTEAGGSVAQLDTIVVEVYEPLVIAGLGALRTATAGWPLEAALGVAGGKPLYASSLSVRSATGSVLVAQSSGDATPTLPTTTDGSVWLAPGHVLMGVFSRPLTAVLEVSVVDARNVSVVATVSIAVSPVLEIRFGGPFAALQPASGRTVLELPMGVAFITPSASVTGGYGAVGFVLAPGQQLPTGLDLAASTGRVSGTPQMVNETQVVRLLGRDANGATVESATVELRVVEPGDCLDPANGPNGRGCGLGGCVDDVPLDDHFTCNCTGQVLGGENCDTDVTDGGSSAAAGAGSSSGSSDGVIAGIVVASVVAVGVLLVVLGVYLHRRREARKPLNFDEQLTALKEQGLIQTKREPRELARSRVRLLAEELGRGNFGVVSKAVFASSHGPEFLVAVKSLRSTGSDADADGQARQSFLAEAAVMAQLEHENVIKLVGVVTSGRPLLAVIEYAEHGSLVDFLRERVGRQALTEEARLLICEDVAKGAGYLASVGMVHRDLAARNVLVTSSYVCKISDFGMSKMLADESEYYRASRGGPVAVRWAAPEAFGSGKYSEASDVWSYGVLVFEVFTSGQMPYKGWSNEMVVTRVHEGSARLQCPDECPAWMCLVLERCWKAEASRRPSFAEILAVLQSGDGIQGPGQVYEIAYSYLAA